MAEIKLSDGALVVTVHGAPEERPARPQALDVLPDTAGAPVVYQRTPGLEEVPLSGRLLSFVDVTRLEAWTAAGALLTLTARDGSQSVGWRVKRGPAPRIRRKDGDSADWLVDLRLWRIP
ncbi:MAG: hypothetical protein ACYC6T_08000 [Thermoleophilia bacterium]